MAKRQDLSQQTIKTPRHSHSAKIAIIGGGNLHCAGFIYSIIQEPEILNGCHITLMDIDEDHLELVYTISSKLFKHTGVEITLERTSNREEAISDADFVITTFRTGGTQAQILDEKIPLKYGLIGQDTIGPGGFFYALRTAPVLASLAAEIEKVAPKAFLLNYTNPSNIVVEAISHSSGIRVIGLDNRATPEVYTLTRNAGISTEPGKRLYPRTVGLNHGHWTTAIWNDGENVLPQIVHWCQNYIDTHPERTPETYEQLMTATLTARYGAIPSYYMHYYYFSDLVLAYQLQQATTASEEFMRQLPHIVAYYQEEAKKEIPDVRNLLGIDHAGKLVLDVVDAILNDTGEEWVLSVPNNGAINFLEDDRVVELPCRVDARGAAPLTQGDGGLSIDQKGLIAALAEYEGATARVALWGNRRDAIKALAANPLVLSYNKAEQVYDELAAAHQQYLPSRLLR